MYEFRPLSVAKSRELLTHLHFHEIRVTKPMTLAEIYNVHIDNQAGVSERPAIGFHNPKQELIPI